MTRIETFTRFASLTATAIFYMCTSAEPVNAQESPTVGHYYFASGACEDAGNDGSDPLRPRCSLPDASFIRAAKPDQQGRVYIKLKSGSVWGNGSVTTWWLKDLDRETIIDRYGGTAHPTIANLDVFANESEWTPSGRPGVWKRALPASYRDVQRCFLSIGGTDTGLHRANSIENLGSEDRYFVKKTVGAPSELFVLSSVKPGVSGTKVIVVPKEHLDGSQTAALRLHNLRAPLSFNHMDFQGGERYAIIATGASRDLKFLKCHVRKFGKFGLALDSRSTRAQGIHERPVVKKCLFDKDWSEEEEDGSEPGGDSIGFWEGVEGGRISGNTIVDCGHTAISIHGIHDESHGVHGNVIELNDVWNRNSKYCRGFGIWGRTGLATGNIVRRNRFHDLVQPPKIYGEGNWVYSNLIWNNGSNSGTRSGTAFKFSPGWDNDDDPVSIGNHVYHNTIHSIEGDGFYGLSARMTDKEGNDMAGNDAVGNRIVNNVVSDWTAGNFAIRIESKEGAMEVLPFSRVAGNCFHSTKTAESPFVINEVLHTVTSALSFDAFGKNRVADPKLSPAPELRLGAGSTCLGLGASLANVFKRAGIPYVDYLGKPFPLEGAVNPGAYAD